MLFDWLEQNSGRLVNWKIGKILAAPSDIGTPGILIIAGANEYLIGNSGKRCKQISIRQEYAPEEIGTCRKSEEPILEWQNA